MFTGIVDHCGTIEQTSPTKGGLALEIGHRFEDLAMGESISVDGVCLTVMQFGGGKFRVELSPETLEKTTARHYKVGARLNLERALRLSDRLGGHMVTGHVDGVVTLKALVDDGEFRRMTFARVPPSYLGLVLEKGSICLNGVSLTLNRVEGDEVEVTLIPHTLDRTNLGALKVGDTLNVEYDWLAKLVARQLERNKT